MEHLSAQIKMLESELAVKRLQLAIDTQKIRKSMGSPQVILKGFLAGFFVGYFILPRHTKQKVFVGNNLSQQYSPVAARSRLLSLLKPAHLLTLVQLLKNF